MSNIDIYLKQQNWKINTKLVYLFTMIDNKKIMNLCIYVFENTFVILSVFQILLF